MGSVRWGGRIHGAGAKKYERDPNRITPSRKHIYATKATRYRNGRGLSRYGTKQKMRHHTLQGYALNVIEVVLYLFERVDTQ